MSGSIGRFLTRDPLGPGADDSLYSYVGSSPASFTDPVGLSRVGASERDAYIPFANVPQAPAPYGLLVMAFIDSWLGVDWDNTETQQWMLRMRDHGSFSIEMGVVFDGDVTATEWRPTGRTRNRMKIQKGERVFEHWEEEWARWVFHLTIYGIRTTVTVMNRHALRGRQAWVYGEYLRGGKVPKHLVKEIEVKSVRREFEWRPREEFLHSVPDLWAEPTIPDIPEPRPDAWRGLRLGVTLCGLVGDTCTGQRRSSRHTSIGGRR